MSVDDQAVALAGLFQAAKLVVALARNGQCDADGYAVSVDSILRYGTPTEVMARYAITMLDSQGQVRWFRADMTRLAVGVKRLLGLDDGSFPRNVDAPRCGRRYTGYVLGVRYTQWTDIRRYYEPKHMGFDRSRCDLDPRLGRYWHSIYRTIQ